MMNFWLKLFKLYFDDNYSNYQIVKEEDITKMVCV